MTDVVTAADVTVLSDPIYQGEGKWFKFTYTVDGEAIDLSTATFAFSVKQNLADSEFIYEAEASAFETSLDGQGIIRVSIPASVTEGMDPGTYWGEMLATVVADTNVDKKLVKFKIKKAVTP